MNFEFETDRLYIREYKKADIDSIHSVVNQKKIYDTTYAIPYPYPKARVLWWIQFVENSNKNGTSYEYGIFNKKTGQYVGNVGLINVALHHNRADITYFIDPDLWGKGYGTEAAKAMLYLGFNQLKLNRIGGICMDINTGSKKVMEKCGFTYEGTAKQEMLKDNIYHDICHYAILKQDYVSSRH